MTTPYHSILNQKNMAHTPSIILSGVWFTIQEYFGQVCSSFCSWISVIMQASSCLMGLCGFSASEIDLLWGGIEMKQEHLHIDTRRPLSLSWLSNSHETESCCKLMTHFTKSLSLTPLATGVMWVPVVCVCVCCVCVCCVCYVCECVCKTKIEIHI